MPDNPAIGADEDRYAGRVGREDKGLISGMRHACVHVGAIGHDGDRQTTSPLIASTRQDNAPSAAL